MIKFEPGDAVLDTHTGLSGVVSRAEKGDSRLWGYWNYTAGWGGPYWAHKKDCIPHPDADNVLVSFAKARLLDEVREA